MDWIVFGDDWGAHPSTEQHLILNLPIEDRVIWVDSIGMRSPSLDIVDLRRIWQKAAAMFSATESESALYSGSLEGFVRVKPKVLPWHLNKSVVRFNSVSLAHSLKRAMRTLGITEPVLLSSTPVVARYLSAIPHRKIIYLRQDDYEIYPGCDPLLVRLTEPELYDASDVIFVTAKSLHPGGNLENKTHYLPQGVRFEHFTKVPLDPPGRKVLGFFGTIDERVDFHLIRAVAEAVPEWRLEFIGEISCKPAWLDEVPNVYFYPAVSYGALPGCISGWSAAWIPYVLNEVTMGINPLKVREYLAAGIATHCTALPEARLLDAQILISGVAREIQGWLEEIDLTDSRSARSARRESVRCYDWSERSVEFREIVLDAIGKKE